MEGNKISAAALCFACILLVSATEGQLAPTPCGIECRPESCGVKSPSDCCAGEEYVQSRRWCPCCLANCCAACVKTVGIRDSCSAIPDGGDGHYDECPSGSRCCRVTRRCVSTNSTLQIQPRGRIPY